MGWKNKIKLWTFDDFKEPTKKTLAGLNSNQITYLSILAFKCD